MSKNVVIIGAGPIGLYLAYKLKRAGIKNVVICDPRAGTYIRSGHLNSSLFEQLENKLQQPLWNKDIGHIKDFERILFNQVSQLNVTIEKKKFVRFHDDPRKKGVIVISQDGQEELIECEYAFDCTGSKRAVIQKLVETDSSIPFTLKPISNEVNVVNHFIAYVNMNHSDLDIIAKAHSDREPLGYSVKHPLQQARIFERLHALGWQQFAFPWCYGAPFGTNKACLYVQCPDHLPEELYALWLNTVIDIQSNSTVAAVTPVPPSKKTGIAKSYGLFAVNPMELEQVSFEGKNLPVVIAMGDSQIDPLYYLAHGIRDGLERVDAFVESIVVLNNNIAYFNGQDYKQDIAPLLKKHRDAIKVHYHDQAMHFETQLYTAHEVYDQAIKHTPSLEERLLLEDRLKQIQGRISLLKAIKLLNKYSDAVGKIVIPNNQLYDVHNALISSFNFLIEAKNKLPANWAAKEELPKHLIRLAAGLKELGNQYVNQLQSKEAIHIYNKALEVLEHLYQRENVAIVELTIYSNLIITLRKLNRPTDVIALARKALTISSEDPDVSRLKNKIMYNLIQSAYAQVATYVQQEDLQSAQSMATTTMQIYEEHYDLHDKENKQELLKEIKSLLRLRSSANTPENSRGFSIF